MNGEDILNEKSREKEVKLWYKQKKLQTKKTISYLQGQDFLVDSEEGRHGLGPRAKTCYITAHLLGVGTCVIWLIEIWPQQLNGLIIDTVLGEGLEAAQEATACHELKDEKQKFCMCSKCRW